ncbi:MULTISPECIES: hypothetical protein [Flavobacteriaceae]|uniref:hypothetical protein n=1 Tax=Flavobacteriaceae TaxID=49546 RepID=UPI0014918CEE|nr:MULTISPECIES: hypothetical protein [Allomuricauda]MDC6365190.1 hypothetical protein [Muricauda sp. AC10]
MKNTKLFFFLIPVALLFFDTTFCTAQKRNQSKQETLVAVSTISKDELANSTHLGLSVGIPSGNLGDVSSFSYGVVAGYKFGVTKNLSAGPEADYTHFVGKDKNIEGFGLISASARIDYSLSKKFGVGGNLGYAFSLKENGGNDLYFSLGPRWRVGKRKHIIIRAEIAFRGSDYEFRGRVMRSW